MSQEKSQLLYQVDEKPPVKEGLLLSVQHVFAMFGATILVPLILGMSVSTALLASGLGTLVYIWVTKAQVPVYLGSSFAYITAMAFANNQMNGNISASQTGIILVGLVYILIAQIIAKTGNGWINRLLPPIVIGPMVIVIGLSLASNAVQNAGFVENTDWRNVLISLFTLGVAITIQTKAKGFLQVIPFLIAIIAGYILSVILGIVDFTPIHEAAWLSFPEISLPFENALTSNTYRLYFGAESLAIVPIALVTIAEHIGDHLALSEITGKNFLKKPGLKKTLVGDGLGTLLSAFIGGPANTTYGENTGVIGITKVASVSVIRNAALIAIAMSCMGKLTALISTIPNAVLGGMSILLYGVIASNGLKVLIRDKTDFNQPRNLIIASAMLVLGLGGAMIEVGTALVVSSTALSALIGIVLNLLLPPAK